MHAAHKRWCVMAEWDDDDFDDDGDDFDGDDGDD